MKKVALVTGASGGIGMELAREHAVKGGDLVVVARSLDKLAALKQELEEKYKISVLVVADDLNDPQAPERIYQQTKSANVFVEFLINNAGIGLLGEFHSTRIESQLSMVQININSLVHLTHLYLQDMLRENRGKILNVASGAGFMPGPLQSVYYATKAFVVSFSEGVKQELNSTGVTVTAFCPGPVNTGFAEAANLEGVNALKFSLSPKRVARSGYRAMEQGKVVAFDTLYLSIFTRGVLPFLPRGLVRWASHQSMKAS